MVLWSDRERSQMGHSSHPRSSQIGYLLPELLMSPKWIGVSRGHMHGFILQICYKLCITESDTQTCCKVINCELHFLQIFLLLVPPRASKFTSDLEFELLDLDNLCSHVSLASNCHYSLNLDRRRRRPNIIHWLRVFDRSKNMPNVTMFKSSI